tara:strand:- start:874 stop:1242 length:369 start_codon:yes stop_codon:yes gene_type:complete
MANTFKNMTFRGGSTSADALTNVGDFGGISDAVAEDSQITLIGMTISNIVSSVISVGVKLINASNQTWIVKDAPIPPGGSLIVCGGDAKICMQFGPSVGDTLSVISDTANSMDVVISYLEIT